MSTGNAPVTHLVSPIVLAVVALMLVLHCPLLRVTVNSYSVLGLRPVIVHGLVVHPAQRGDGGVQLTEVVMSLGSLGWSHCRVTVSHDCVVATTLVGGGSGSGATGSAWSNEQDIPLLTINQVNNTVHSYASTTSIILYYSFVSGSDKRSYLTTLTESMTFELTCM